MKLGKRKINNKVVTFAIGLGIGICLNLGVEADVNILSSLVTYDNANSGLAATNVQDALDETYSRMTNLKNEIKAELVNDVYPVGSIYISTIDDTVEDVEGRFGGTWVKYSEGTTLIGANSKYAVNSTGGSSTVKLSTSNIPSHNHTIPALSVSSWSGSHSHKDWIWHDTGGGTLRYAPTTGNMTVQGQTSFATITVSGQKTIASNTTGCTNCSATSFSVQNPYTAVYMYKRVS